ncbi:propanoyl-CoA C-acyltransferase [Plasmodiophora brassicae]|uniref:propanoyl-CoA C-acyltransferase n=1 Tax=Plasmodiophora brassicae TaxID=37360 RepID=A0A3P3Y5Z5_PLABS|nr:unnamed protein product [Plasmodiophora brassicae]
MGKRVFVVGVGMTHFDKPGRRKDVDYPDYAVEAATKALIDANLTYDDIGFAAVGYVYGDSTCGQRCLYELGLTQIPIVNVNNNCSTGSTALYVARQAILCGQTSCAMALGFEKMAPGSLATVWKDRTNPLGRLLKDMASVRGYDTKAPFAAQIFSNAGVEYLEQHGGPPAALDAIAAKSHNHSTLNPYAQHNHPASIDDVRNARRIVGPLTLLHCSPTSDGAACAIVADEEFVVRHGLQRQAIEILSQELVTDSTMAFDPARQKPPSCVELAGADMTRTAARRAYAAAGITPADVSVVELHDCFSANELITYDALGLCPPGRAAEYAMSGATTLPQFRAKEPSPQDRATIVNPSGGLISKGHPLGATGLAQCCELSWQLRGWAGPRQVPNADKALQHNIGLGGAVVLTIYGRPAQPLETGAESRPDEDPRKRFGYNPAVECRQIAASDVQRVMSRRGSLSGTPGRVYGDRVAQVGRTAQHSNL